MNYRRLSLKHKLIAVITLTVAISLLLAFSIYVLQQFRWQKQNSHEHIASLADAVAKNAAIPLRSGDRTALDAVLNPLRALEFAIGNANWSSDSIERLLTARMRRPHRAWARNSNLAYPSFSACCPRCKK
jgi:uncharacterized membrane protein affecting hemolysin expression